MPKPGEHKTVQARILKYAEEIGWIFVPREEVAAFGATAAISQVATFIL